MKRLSLILLLSVSLHTAAQESISARERAREQLAIRAAAARLMQIARDDADDSSRLAPEIVRYLAGAMDSATPEHVTATQSLTRCRALAADAIRLELAKSWSNAFAQIQGQTGQPVPEQALQSLLGDEWKQLTEQTINRYQQQHVDSLYRDARAQAVARQKRRVDESAKAPAQDWFDQRLAPLINDEYQLATDAIARIAKDIRVDESAESSPLLEEVETHIQQRASQWTELAVAAMEDQLSVLRKAPVPSEQKIAEAIEQSLKLELGQSAERFRQRAIAQGSPVRIDQLYSSVRSRVRLRAEQIEQDRLSSFVEQYAYTAPSSGDLTKRIAEDPVAHREPEASLSLLVTQEESSTRTRVAEAYSPDHASYIVAQLAGAGAARDALQSRIRDGLRPVWLSTRELLSGRMVADRLSASLERTAPDEAVAQQWRERKQKSVQSLKDAIDRLAAEKKTVDTRPMLVEAETGLVARVKSRVAMAVETIEEQEDVLRELEKEWKGDLLRDVESGLSLNKLQSKWRAEWNKRWALRAPANGWYAAMLDRTGQELEKTVRQLYDSRQQQLAASNPKEQSKEDPKEPQQPAVDAIRDGTAPPETDRSEKKSAAGMSDEVMLASADIVLRLGDRSLREGEARLSEGDDRRASFDYDPAAAQAAADAIFTHIEQPFRAILTARAPQWQKQDDAFTLFRKKSPPEIKVYVVVEGNEVRHRTSLLLRRKVESLVDAWSAENRPGLEPLRLRWTVGLGESD